MLWRQVVISVIVAVIINLLLASESFFLARVIVTQKIIDVARGFLFHRFFPDGLLSIGAIIIIKDYIKDQLQQLGSFIRLKLTFHQ